MMFQKLQNKRRVNWKKKLKEERASVLNEAIDLIRRKARAEPKEYQRGYFSAITTLEILSGQRVNHEEKNTKAVHR